MEEPAMGTLTDKRRTYTFYVDDVVLDVFGPRIGAYGIAVYTLLARHAKQKQCFPSYRHIMKQLDISRERLWKTITVLINEGLIQKVQRETVRGGTTSNLYILMDLSKFHEHDESTPITTWGSSPDELANEPSQATTWGSTPDEPPSTPDEPPSTPDEPHLKESLLRDLSEGEKPPSLTTFGNPPRGKRQRKEQSPDGSIVLDHLNQVTGRSYRVQGEIPGCLRRGATVAECLLVIDWWRAVKTVSDPGQEQNFDQTTPFRESNFEKYRAAAVVWETHGRPLGSAKHLRVDTHGLTEKEYRTVMNSKAVMEELADDDSERQTTLLSSPQLNGRHVCR